jgi:hypothetical protein
LKKYLSAFVCGFGAGVLHIVPVAKSFTCCLIMPMAAYLSIILDRKSSGDSGKMDMRRGAMLGFLTGIYAAAFGTSLDILITFITKNNEIVAAYPELNRLLYDFPISEAMKQEVLAMLSSLINEIKTTGFSFLYSITILISNFIIDPVFGILGGMIGVQVVNSKISRE